MTRRIGLVVYDGVTLLDASGPAEVFRLADPQGSAYELVLLSPRGGEVQTSSGIRILSTAAAQIDAVDTLLIAGGEILVQEPLDPDVLVLVERLSVGATRVASVCTGAFVLAQLDFLQCRRATTHWRHADELARRFPGVTVEPDIIHVRDGRFLSSAGITAGIDLALAMVEEDLGAEVARRVARELVMFMQRPGGQSQYSTALRRKTVSSDPLRRLMDMIVADPSQHYSVSVMARSMGVSARHLNRLFREEAGTTPARWLEEARVDAARALILESHPISRVAHLSGFGSEETLRRAFAKHLGATPSAFRDRFATTSVPSAR
ncbi:MAG: GlxA family transcriptional regulator [Micrococcaceae bacterium]